MFGVWGRGSGGYVVVVVFEALGQGVARVVGDAGQVEALGHMGVGQVEPAGSCLVRHV